MVWYYEHDGRREGPVDDGELARLVADGSIRENTLVWRQGFAGWQPYGGVRGGAEPAAADGFCSQCRRAFPTSEMVRFGDRWVCAECKPLFVQRLREGVATPGQLVYGGFWIRFAARLLDGLLLFAVNALLSMPMIFYSLKFAGQRSPSGPPPAFFVITCFTYLLQFATQAAYEIYFLSKSGATPGKMACRLRVVRSDGSKLTVGRATGRYFANLLNAFTLGIGYIIAAFDEQKRALHDHICDTRVVAS
jgi:uncharacterized RDD family membrane protein YckC